MNLRRPIAFIVVGSCAAAVHFAIAFAVLTWHAATPQIANILGWTVAFVVSYSGHARLTFSQQRLSSRTLWRFLLTSILALAMNASCYAALLALTSTDPRLLLIIAILVAAIFTFYLSKGWAFRERLAVALQR